MSKIRYFFKSIISLSFVEKTKYVCYFLGGFSFLSIPLFAINNRYITWALFALFAISMIVFLIAKKRISFTLVSFDAVCFFAIAILSTLLNGSRIVFTIFLLGILFVLIHSFLSDEIVSPSAFCLCLYFFTAVFGIIFLISNSSGIIAAISNGSSTIRLGGNYGDENEIAMFLSFGFTLSLYYLLLTKHKLFCKIFYTIFLCVFIVLGFLSGTKMFLLSSAVSLITCIFLAFGKKRWIFSIIVIFAFIIFTIIILQLPIFATIKNRISLMLASILSGNFSDDYSTSNRILMIQDAFSLFLRKPFFGFGIDSYYYYSSFGGGGWTHNELAEIASSYGIMGLFSLLFIYYYFFNKFFTKPKQDKRQLLYLLLVVFLFLWMLSMALETLKIYPFCLAICCSGVLKEKAPLYVISFSKKRLHFSIVNKDFKESRSGAIIEEPFYEVNI